MSQILKVNLRAITGWRKIENKVNCESIWKIQISKLLFLTLTFMAVSITLNGQCSMSCNNGLQISISGIPNCEAIIDAQLMLANPATCPGPKNTIITNEYGQTLPQTSLADGSIASIVGVNNIGQTLLVTVSHLASGNSCWGYINVEDKIAPVISNCGPVDIFCFQNTAPMTEGGNVPVPTADDCSLVSSTYYDVFIDEECDALASARINRNWTFTDVYNNVSTCIQEISIERVSISDYTPICPETKSLECNAADQPSIHPDDTGYPFIDIDGSLSTTGDLFVLDNNEIGHCELGISYSDEIIELCGHSFKAIRTWTVYDWCAPTQPGVNPWTCIQIIKVEDTTAPVMTPLSNITIGTGSNNCSAVLNLPSILVNDNCTNNIDVITVTSLGTLNSNGGVVPFPGLPLGNNVITYIATDECGNSSSSNLIVTVEDNSPPVVVCDVITSVSLKADGTAIIYAETFDDGSHDNCGIAGYAVQRMTNNCLPESPYGPFVSFNCCDIENGPVTVAMQVTDIHGNTNLCMINVAVQDKTDPLISCPPEKYLDCFQDWTDLELTGTATAIDACGIDTIYHQDYGTVNECGYGDIQRVWTVLDNHDNISTCIQWIHISNNNPFTVDNIVWPLDYTTNTCGGGLEPEDIPSPFNEPLITEGYCDLIALTFEDTYLPITAPACFKILRRWIVVDWCLYNPNDPNTDGYYEYNQIVKVLNSENPEFTSSCESQSFCSYEANCGSTLITLTASGSDDCTAASQLNFSYEIDENFDGTIDHSGSGNTFQGYVGLGTHWIKWYLEDGCGNLVTCDYEFVVSDCKNPSPYCLNGISVDLMPEFNSVTIWAADLDAGSYDNCGIAEYRIHAPSMGSGQNIPPTGSTNSFTFDCDALGTQEVDFWVLDIHGNWDYCSTYVIIQDNAQNCINNTPAIVYGRIENENGVGIKGVDINISGNSNYSVTTETDGSFESPNLELGGNYTLTPEKDINYLNGVSTFDLVLLSRHILGINYLDSPYKMIAADVNNSGSISTIDIVFLRKLILQIDDSFSNNQSWRFIESNFVFPNASNPFESSFPEAIDFNGLDQDVLADFIAIKVGDVNGNAIPGNYAGGADDRNIGSIALNIQDQKLQKGDDVRIAVFSDDFININGFQFALEIDPELMILKEIKAENLNGFNSSNYNLQKQENGKIMVSWHHSEKISIRADEPIFELVFDIKENIQLSNKIKLSTSVLKSEIYQENGLGTIDRLGLSMNYKPEVFESNGLANDKGQLLQNKPNPFYENTKIPFFIPSNASVSLTIFDINGKVLWNKVNYFEQGWNDFELQAASLKGSGLMYYQIETDTFRATRKMLFIE